MRPSPTSTIREIRHAHMFCGIGVGARGFNLAAPRVGSVQARFVCAGGIDVDPGAIHNFTRLTGTPGTVLDLFSREQYVRFHGKEPPAGWREATPADIRRVLDPSHPAATEARTPFPRSVVHVSQSPLVLIDGYNQRKIGRRVTKGRWKGFRIFTVTLEERATCPSSCHQWLSCYGNGMHLARRHMPGKDFEERLLRELAGLNRKYPRGFVVRVHVLGDFYSVDYVRLWAEALDRFSGLHVFGYTAHAPESEIGQPLFRLALDRWERFAMRFSGHGLYFLGAETIDPGEATPHIICPSQLDKTDCCATCALCWHSDRTIAFLRH